jgi:ribokinase
MTASIIVIGSSNTDFIMKMDRLPRKGETITNASFLQTYGGKGANQAVGAARAGGRVFFVNCVGDDPFGPLIIENLRQAGVQTDCMIQETGITSGSALVMIDANGDNYLSVAPGANYRLLPEHIWALRDTVESAAMVVLQYEVLPETLYAALDLAYTLGKPVLFNYAPARPLEIESLKKVALLVVNEVEAEYLCRFPLDSDAAIREAAGALRQLGPQTVVITLGSKGALVADGAEAFSVPAFPVQVVDTTAAGDVFCGVLAVALVEGQPLAGAVRFACAASAISVTRLGAQPSAPTREEIQRFLQAHPAE